MIVFRTPKGWTCPKEIDGRRDRGLLARHIKCRWARCTRTWRTCSILEEWMKSYRPTELFDENGRLRPELAELAPKGNRRMSANPHANGGCSCVICDCRISATTRSRCQRPGASRRSPPALWAGSCAT